MCQSLYLRFSPVHRCQTHVKCECKHVPLNKSIANYADLFWSYFVFSVTSVWPNTINAQPPRSMHTSVYLPATALPSISGPMIRLILSHVEPLERFSFKKRWWNYRHHVSTRQAFYLSSCIGVDIDRMNSFATCKTSSMHKCSMRCIFCTVYPKRANRISAKTSWFASTSNNRRRTRWMMIGWHMTATQGHNNWL